MDRIPSALERALERVEKLGKASAEDLQRSKLKEEGQRLAAQYLNGEASLRSELGNYEDGPERSGLVEGIEEVLIRNLALPTTDAAKDRNRLAMDGLKLTKKDPGAVENIFSKMRQIFNHYTGQGEMQRKEAYENLKRDMQMRLSQVARQQGMPPIDMQHMENHPQFQMEWRKAKAQLESQYDLYMKEYKEQLTSLP